VHSKFGRKKSESEDLQLFKYLDQVMISSYDKIRKKKKSAKFDVP